ncbi:MAG: dNTP triphosphohydrolase [Lentisphaeria bacterium]
MDDPRSPSEKDVDRIIYCSAFARLAYTTQVFDPTHGARYHNRLTHSLKVAQLARRISAKLIRDDASIADKLDANVTEAAALAHDLGHPPFGHVGEHVLDELLRNKGIDDGFEGNAQTFRILTTLAMRTAGSKGLDLTAATVLGTYASNSLRHK